MSRSILKQSSKIGFFALISRCIAFLREIFLIRFLSIGENSDIFFTAIRIPNTMRKIFAEGSLSSVLVPAFINAEYKQGKLGLNRLTTFSFFVIELCMVVMCAAIFYWADAAIHLIVPGFSQEKVEQCVGLLRILLPFILLISSGSIFAASLQSQKNFFIPSLAPSILNICYVLSLMGCLYFGWSVTVFCYSWIVTALIFFLMHVIAYVQTGYGFDWANASTVIEFKKILVQFLPCFISVGIVEINHFINTGFCSYLQGGSLTLLRCTFQFINIPIGIIAASLVTVLLPHFSKLYLEKPEELSNQVFEALKFVVWTTLPICFFMFLFSRQIFETLFFGDQAALQKVPAAQAIFIAYLIGLIFFSLNKVFSSIFYALRLTNVPLISSLVSIVVNFSLNRILMTDYGASGIAFSASMAALAQTIIFLIVLHKKLHFQWSASAWADFFLRYLMQLVCCIPLFWFFFILGQWLLTTFDISLSFLGFIFTNDFFMHGLGFWLWVGPIIALFCVSLYVTRHTFGIKLSYFD